MMAQKLVTHIGEGSRNKNKSRMKIIKKVAPNCGYIVWKDRKEVVFYTNDLINTPIKYCLYSTNESDSEEAIRCLGGLANVER